MPLEHILNSQVYYITFIEVRRNRPFHGRSKEPIFLYPHPSGGMRRAIIGTCKSAYTKGYALS